MRLGWKCKRTTIKKRSRKVLDCRINGEYKPENTQNKVLVYIQREKQYNFVDKSKIDTKEKKAEYIQKYLDDLDFSRKKFNEISFKSLNL